MRVYIAGPMRNLPAFNFPAFADAAAVLRTAGHEVFNPAERDLELGFDPTNLTGAEDLSALGFDLRTALAADTGWIARDAHALCLLPGWEWSSGAWAEVSLAAALGLLAGSEADVLEGTLRPAAEVLVEGTARRAEADAWAAAAVPLPAPAGTGEVRVTASTGGQKGSKPQRFDLIPTGPLWQLATLYGVGAEKYEERNWERGYPWALSFAALQRHAWAWWNGQDLDPEHGLSHMASVAWHAFALMEYAQAHPEFDNRPGVQRTAEPAA